MKNRELMDLAEQEKGSSYIPAPITIGRKENWVRIVNWGRMDLLKTFIVIGREVFCQKKKKENLKKEIAFIIQLPFVKSFVYKLLLPIFYCWDQ
jgi:hypothetical protein